MSKPTPGPTHLGTWIRKYFDVEESDSVDVTIDGIVEMVKSLEVEGRAAVETLAKIRAAMEAVEQCERAFEVRDRVLEILGRKAST